MKLRFFSWIPFIAGAFFLTSLQAKLGWLVVIFGIGFLIFIHELGHFCVAKLEGVRVLSFALGFGFPIIKIHYHGTDYRINALPLGGYVQMAGENPDSKNTGAPDEFISQPPGAKARIIVAGVTMNFIFGIIGTIIAFHIGIQFPAPIIGSVAPGTPAWHSNLQPGDKIVSINGHQINNFKEIKTEIAFCDAEKGIDLQIERQGKMITSSIKPIYDENSGMLLIGINPYYDSLTVEEDSFLYKAGLRTDDKIVRFNNVEIKNALALYELLQTDQDKTDIEVERKGEKLSFSIEFPKEEVPQIGIIASDLCISDVRQGSMAAQQGLVKNDKIISVNGMPIYRLSELKNAIQDKQTFSLSILRNGEILTQDYNNNETFCQDIYCDADLTIGSIKDDSPAKQYLQVGDVITSINETQVTNWKELRQIIATSKGQALKVAYTRNNAPQEAISITPHMAKLIDASVFAFFPKKTEITKYGIWESCKHGLNDAKNMILDIFLMIKGLWKKQISTKNLGGPVVIFQASHSQLQLGFGYFLYFLAIISINLAVINLFPIPILDGGYLFILLIEKIIRRKIPDKVLTIANYIGMFLLLSLMIYVTYNDILRLLFH